MKVTSRGSRRRREKELCSAAGVAQGQMSRRFREFRIAYSHTAIGSDGERDLLRTEICNLSVENLHFLEANHGISIVLTPTSKELFRK